MERTVTIPTAAIGNAVAAYTVGFVKLEVHDKVEDGTLVRVGKVHGILTAAHVLAHLPDSGAVGIVEYRGETMHYRKRQIEMADTVKVALRGDAFGPDGPDIGFLRLAAETVGWFGVCAIVLADHRSIRPFGNSEIHRARLACRYQQKYQQSGRPQWAFA